MSKVPLSFSITSSAFGYVHYPIQLERYFCWKSRSSSSTIFYFNNSRRMGLKRFFWFRSCWCGRSYSVSKSWRHWHAIRTRYCQQFFTLFSGLPVHIVRPLVAKSKSFCRDCTGTVADSSNSFSSFPYRQGGWNVADDFFSCFLVLESAHLCREDPFNSWHWLIAFPLPLPPIRKPNSCTIPYKSPSFILFL